ncbi:hypothetical protein AAMO2058_001727300 [Amorphochlora amoebiformis]
MASGRLVGTLFVFCMPFLGQCRQIRGGKRMTVAENSTFASLRVDFSGLPTTSYAPIVEKTLCSVVAVVATAMSAPQKIKIDGVGVLYKEAQPRKSMGSGAIFDKSGLVLTNFHVIDEKNCSYTVNLCGERAYKAEVVAKDSITDLAILRLKEPADGKGEIKEFKPIAIGDATKSKVGDIVLAMGNNLGFAGTVTAGMLSAVGRTMEESASLKTEKEHRSLQPYLQTDAAVNVGSSGGPLLNMEGELIGINTAIVSPGKSGGNVGIAFAVPSNLLHPIVKAATESKEMVWPSDGIEEVCNDPEGVKVKKIAHSSPAEKAGIKEGDVIMKIVTPTGDDEKDKSPIVRTISTTSLYKMHLMSLDVGSTYTYTIKHDGHKPDLDATISDALGGLGALFGGGSGAGSTEKQE